MLENAQNQLLLQQFCYYSTVFVMIFAVVTFTEYSSVDVVWHLMIQLVSGFLILQKVSPQQLGKEPLNQLKVGYI
jgi:hypothetical protein